MPKITNQEVSAWIRANADEFEGKAPAITDALIKEVYSSVVKPLKEAGAYSHFRNGLREYVANILKGWNEQRGKNKLKPEQLHFSSVSEDFRPLLVEINRDRIYIPSQENYEPILPLIENNEVGKIKEAYEHLRNGAMDDLRVADLLQALYDKMAAKMRH